MYNATNNAHDRLSLPASMSDTQITLVDASSFPEAPFVISIYDEEHQEIVEVNSRDGNVLSNLVRGFENTKKREWPADSFVENRWTAGTYGKLKSTLEGLFIEEGADWEADE